MIQSERTICTACDGDGKSREPFWHNCFSCCGAGDIPKSIFGVIEQDIGNGVGLRIAYCPTTGRRVSASIFGDLFEQMVGTPPQAAQLRSAINPWPIVVAYVESGFLDDDHPAWEQCFFMRPYYDPMPPPQTGDGNDENVPF